jgi:hypothetical protein
MQFLIFDFLNRNKLILLLSILAGIFYFIIIQNLGSIDFIKSSLYFTKDSLEYKSYADWISGNSETGIFYRTFLFPLLIFISEKLLGFYGIWIFQFVFWLTGCILVFQTMLRLTRRNDLSMLSFVIVVSNISLIVYTAHALTETSTFFLLTLLMYLLTFAGKEHKKPFILLSIIFVLAALAAIKPLFQPAWYFGIIVIIIVHFNLIIYKPQLILIFILASSPVIIQKSINKINTGSYSSTKIADNTLRYYLYKKVKFYTDINKNQQINRNFNELPDSAQTSLNSNVSKVEKADMMKYLLSHPIASLKVYWENIHENLGSGNPYIDRRKNHVLSKWTENINHNFIFYIHLLMTFLWIYYIARNFKNHSIESHFILIGGLLTFYILYSSGISFWAGNRLIIPAIAVWSVLYPLMVYKFFTSRT